MNSNISKYKADLQKLIELGGDLHNGIQLETYPEEFIKEAKKQLGDKYDSFKNKIPSFTNTYQSWYSESLSIVKQLLPDRLEDFTRHYERPKTRKEITHSNYVIEDYLQGTRIKNSFGEILVGPSSAVSRFLQQLNILKSLSQRFESTLFDIRQLVQADLFDSELDSAKELSKNKFYRASGIIAGVVLEKHLGQVCENHNMTMSKKNPTINDYNETLKVQNIIDVPQWRFIQHLSDIRNNCCHSKQNEPKPEEVEDLINGVTKITKTIF